MPYLKGIPRNGRLLSEHVGEGVVILPFLGVCEQKQFLIIYLKCYCLNTFAVIFMQGGKG